MNNERNNGRGIFYGVIGVATLVVAIIGATFAYFTATASNNVITGNMAKVSLSLHVEKVTKADELKGGMIPLSNGMVEQAVNKIYANTEPKASGDGTEQVNRVCIDDNGNAVCQIYKITITNDSTAGQFVDGYVALRGGSGVEPTDVPTGYGDYKNNSRVDEGVASGGTAGTTMRWAQVFPVASAVNFTTAGTQSLGTGSGEEVTFTTALGDASDPFAHKNIRYTKGYMLPAKSTDQDTNKNGICDASEKTAGCEDGTADPTAVLTSVSIAGNYYDVIGTNYIRLSDHAWATGETTTESYDRTTDITSALVFNNSIPAGGHEDYYVVVWLSETGTNQTPGATPVEGSTNPVASKFFLGNVTFVSAQGSEVSATFSGYSRVPSDSVQS